MTGYTEVITFITNLGTFPDGSQEINTNNSNVTYENGVATVELFPAGNRGTSTITVSSGVGVLDQVTVEVKFYTDPDHIHLAADPPNIYAGGETSTITATIVDKWEYTIDDYVGTVNFSITLGSSCGELIGDTEVVVSNGIAEVTLQSLQPLNNSGTVTVMAEVSSLFVSTINIEVVELVLVDITLILVEGSVDYSTDNKIITFNIEIDGPTLNLNRMMVEWVLHPSGQIDTIKIKSPSTAVDYDPIINTTGSASSPHTEYNIDKDLSPGVSTIRLIFSKDMEGVPLVVTFYTYYGVYELTGYVLTIH
ncbi:hypothetical protein ES708_21647 [subsurface metagenome]